MDTLFGYINKEESSAIFIKKVEKYAEDNAYYEDCVKQFNNIFHNIERDDLIQNDESKITSFIDEMNVLNLKLTSVESTRNLRRDFTEDMTVNLNREVIIHDLVEMQIKVAEMSKKLMELKYELNEVVIKVDEKDEIIKKSKLSQSNVKFHNKFISLEKPEVLKFNFFKY
jgi:hypothetical protein